MIEHLDGFDMRLEEEVCAFLHRCHSWQDTVGAERWFGLLQILSIALSFAAVIYWWQQILFERVVDGCGRDCSRQVEQALETCPESIANHECLAI